MSASAEDSTSPGTTLGEGRFVIVSVLGEGAQGRTFEAVDKSSGRLVALKQFSVRGARHWKDVELAEREAEVLAGLDHPLLPKYVAHFEEAGCLYLALERIEGRTLAQLQQRGKVAQRDVIAFLRDGAVTLDYLHGLAPPIIHRDIKPSNVIQRPDGRYVLVDFGSVSQRLRPEGGSTVVGTFGFMAPEQFQGRAMPASDVYSLAATALALLTGSEPDKLPHQGLGIDVPRALGPSADPRLVALLTEALDPNPDARAQLSLSGLLRKHALDAAARGADSSAPAHRAGKSAGDRAGQSAYASDQARFDAASGPPSSDRGRARRRRSARRERDADRPEPAEAVRPFGSRDAQRWLAHPMIVFGALVGLAIARLGTALVMVVMLPMLMALLSLVFGSGLRRGAHDVRRAGQEAQRALGLAAARIQATARDVHARSRQQGEPRDTTSQRPATERTPRYRVDERETEARVDEWSEELERTLEEKLERAARELERKFGGPRR